MPVDDQHSHLGLVSVDYLTNASVDWSNYFWLRGCARFAMLFFVSHLEFGFHHMREPPLRKT
jgi:hypothetical protein